MTIFNIIIILSISEKELFHFGTFRPSKKNKKNYFNWITIAYGEKIQQLFGRNYSNNLNIRGNTDKKIKLAEIKLRSAYKWSPKIIFTLDDAETYNKLMKLCGE